MIVLLKEIFFSHLAIHFKSHETVACVFKNCNFKTNIHGTYHSHRNQRHKPHTADDFKTGIVTTTAVSQELPDNSEHDESEVEMDIDPNDVDSRATLPDTIKQNFAAALFKLEHFAHVPATKMDEFLKELHF